MTLNTLVQGAWALLLSRYSGEEDVIFGAVTSGRSAPVAGIEETVGLFINTLPARVRVPPAADWVGWARTLQQQQLELREYEHTPLSQVQGWSELPRGVPLFENVLAFENYPMDAALERRAGEGMGVVRAEQTEQTNYPVTLAVLADTRLNLRLLYEAHRFDGPTVQRLMGHLEALLAGVRSHPAGGPLAALPLLSAEERHQVLEEWGARHSSPSGELVFPEIFAAQAARGPDAIAVAWGDEALSYGELDRRACRWAGSLRRLGVGPDVVVALLAARSPLLLTVILAVYKAGGAYLPLDPRHPRLRHREIVLRSGAALVLAESERAEELQQDLDAVAPVRRPLVLALPMAALAAAGAEVSSPCAPSNLAYVIYTSGSTGAPKGVMVQHRGMLGHLAAKIAELELGCADRVAQTASQCFDISVWQSLAALAVGGTVCIAPDELARDPQGLWSFLSREEITVLEVVPSFLDGVLDWLAGTGTEPRAPSSLRWLIITGESCLPETCRRWRSSFPAVQVLNAYGPTECSDNVTHQVIRGPATDPGHHVPIGRAIPGSRLHVLDRWGGMAPCGVPGELHVGGACLGRGYLGDSARTAGAFVPDPLAGLHGEPGARLYKTGDQARLGPDGALEFLGRRDHQVKIRGFRIELGEIEARLTEHPAVQRAVAVVRKDGPGPPRLIAYVVCREPAPASTRELKAFLAERLPDYMLPAVLVALEALPLTANGKVDRKALPAPERGSKETQPAPRGQLEELLALVFSQVLHVDPVGMDDDFFALGGHSLLVTRVAALASRSLGIELPLRTVLEAPTVRALAARAELLMGAGGAAQFSLEKARRDRQLPLSFAQQRRWRLEQRAPRSAEHNIPNAVRLQCPLDAGALAASLSEIVRRHEILRTGFAAVAGEPIQVVFPAGAFSLPHVDLAGLPDAARWAEVRRLRKEEGNRLFDLSRPPLLRAAVLKLAADDHAVLLTSHEIVSDGLSTGILLRELAILYEAFRRSQASPLPELTVQYADFAIWQRRCLTGDALAAELAWWRAQLGNALRPLGLRTDRSGPAGGAARAGLRGFTIGEAQLERLGSLARRCGATLFMTLVATFQALLARYADQEEVSVGTPAAGRLDPQVEPLIGRFANWLVLRTRVAGDPAFSALLARVREVTLGAYAHQSLPFDRLLEDYGAADDHSRLFQAWLSLTPGGEVPELPSLRWARLPSEDAELTHFDLSLVLVEAGRRLGGSLAYRTDLFDRATVERMGSQLANLLTAVTDAPDRPLSAAPLLGDAERHMLLLEWRARPPALDGAPGPGDDLFARIMDRHLQLAPLGAKGELCLCGPGLGRSIPGRADLTAERFVPDPCGGERGARLFRTGVVAALLPGGQITQMLGDAAVAQPKPVLETSR
jgi:amino acid adenylation domain-containing protein